MTREELSKLITERNEDVAKSDIPKVINPIMDIYQKGFMTGMDVGKELVVEKACDWIQMNAERYMRSIGGCMYFDVINSVNDFKRAMEE